MNISVSFGAVAIWGALACKPPQGAGQESPTIDKATGSEPYGSTTGLPNPARYRTAANSAAERSDAVKDVPVESVEATSADISTASSSPQPLQVAILADTDPNNDGEVAPPLEWAGCLEELTRNDAQFTPADIPLSQKRGEVFTCGATQVVVYKGRRSSPKYNAAPRLTCRMALGLIRFEELAQKLAQKHFNSSVVRIEQGGTYSCRKMARFADLVSEHSYANAIDIKSLKLSNGRTISVKRHFGDLASAPATAASSFLRELASSLYDEGVFSVVLTPYFDRLHHDHFHFDQARYRVDGTR